MKQLHFETRINAPIEKVWSTMLDDATYRQWTSVFMPGSHYIGNWEVGSKISFLAPNEDGKLSGLVGVIAENKPLEFISIQYLGFIDDGIEDTSSDAAKASAESRENYTFHETDGTTELSVDIGVHDDYADMFNGMWPKALEALKNLAEKI